MPAIVGSAEWENVTKGQTGIRWDSVVEEMWRDIVGNRNEMKPIGEFRGWMIKVRDTIWRTGKEPPRRQEDKEGYWKIYARLREGIIS